MKKMSVALSASIVAALAVGNAMAEPQDNNAAFHTKDGTCWAFGLKSKKMTLTSTSSGNTQAVCQFALTEAQTPKQSEKKTGFSCYVYTPNGTKVTTDTSFQKNPGGTAKLTCMVKL